MRKFLIFFFIITIATSIKETTEHGDCINQYCSAEAEACRKDSTWYIYFIYSSKK